MSLAIIDPLPTGVTPARPLVIIENGENAGEASRQASLATAAADLAEAHAETAQVASMTLPNVYADTATGLAAVAANETFWVYDAGFIKLYRDIAGVAVLLDSLALSTAVQAQAAFGSAASQGVDSMLNGSPVAADIGPLFIGHNTTSADAITVDTAANWPGGDAYRRSRGTLATPTPVAAGDQLGYRDYRAYNSDGLGGGFYYNVGSHDVLVDGGVAFGPGQPPRTFMRFAICWNDDEAEEVARFQPFADDGATPRGGGLWVGYIPANDTANPLAPRNSALPRIYGVTHNGDWAANFDSRYSAGQALGVRFDLSRNNNTDYFAAFAYNNTILASIRGDGMGIFSRMRIGREDDPSFGSPTLAISNAVNDYCFTAESRPASGAGFAARFHTLGETASDYIFLASSGVGTGTVKASIRGDGSIRDITALYVGSTKVLGAQGAAVADATDAASAITQLNALLARCRAHGLVAT